jgi:5-methylcytosine-specific restriction endonuclease McrA
MTIPEQNKLKKLLHQLVVVRDKKCLRCDATKALQASHIKSKGAYPQMKWNPRNVKALCYRCHFYFWHKEPIDAYKWYKKLNPTNLRYLEKKSLENNGLKKHLDYEYNKRILEKEIKKYER